MEAATAGMALPQQQAAVPASLCNIADFEKLAAAALSVHQAERQEAERVLLQVQQHNIEVMDMCLCLLRQSTNAATLSVAVVVLRNAAVAQWNKRQLAYEASLRRKGVHALAAGVAAAAEAEVPERQQQLLEFEAKILQLVQAMIELLQHHAAADAEAAAAAAAAGLPPPPVPPERRVVDRQLMHAVAVLTKKGLAANRGGASAIRGALVQRLLSLVHQATPLADGTSLLSCILLGTPAGGGGGGPANSAATGTGAAVGGGSAFVGPSSSLAAAGATLALQILTELAREISSSQLSLLQLTMQQHVECKKLFEKRILLPIADNTLAILNLLLNANPSQQQQQQQQPFASLLLQRIRQNLLVHTFPPSHETNRPPSTVTEKTSLGNAGSFLITQLQRIQTAFVGTQASVAMLELLMDWNFASFLLRFLSPYDISFAPSAEWVPIFFPSSDSNDLMGGNRVIAVPSPPSSLGGVMNAVGDGVTQQQQQQQPLLLVPGQRERPNLFALVLQLYKQLAAQRHQHPELFRSARLIMTRLAKFRAYRMVDAFFSSSSAPAGAPRTTAHVVAAADEHSAAATASSSSTSGGPSVDGGVGPASPTTTAAAAAAAAGAAKQHHSLQQQQQIPLLPRSSSGPLSRPRKLEITAVVYVPLVEVILDLIQNSAFMQSPTAVTAAAAAANAAAALAAASRTPDGAPAGGERVAVASALGAAALSLDDEENLEEVRDLCFALLNLSECAEAVPEGIFDGTAAKAFPLFVQLFRALLGTILRADAAATAQGHTGRDGRKIAAGECDEGIEAGVGALEFLLRALSGWADRLQQQLLQQQKPDRQPQDQHMLQQQHPQQLPLEQRPWWNTFVHVTELVLETFIMFSTDSAAALSLVHTSAVLSSLVCAVVSSSAAHKLQSSINGLSVSGHRDPTPASSSEAPPRGGVGAGGGSSSLQGGVGGVTADGAGDGSKRGGSSGLAVETAPLYDFLHCFAMLSRCCLCKALLLSIRKLQDLQEELRLLRQRKAAATTHLDATATHATTTGANNLQRQQQLKQLETLEELLYDDMHFLLLLAQQFVVVPAPGFAGKDRGTAPQQLLRDRDAQLALVQLTGRVFGLLEEETQRQEQQRQQQQMSGAAAGHVELVVSPSILEGALAVLSRISGSYLLRSRWTSPMMLAELTSADKGQQVMNAFVGLASKLLRLLPHEEALTLECSHLLHVLALSDNPTVAYLWESPNFQSLLSDACTSAEELLVNNKSLVASGVSNGLGEGRRDGGGGGVGGAGTASQQQGSGLPLQLLSQKAIVCLYTAFSASTSMNDHIWSLAKLHVEEQSLQRSSTLLAGEVVQQRQQQLLLKCEPIRANLRQLALSPVDSHPLVLHALNCSLSMAVGLVVGCTPQSVDAFIAWLRDALDYFFTIASKYVHYPQILHTALKFFYRVVKAGFRCFTSEAAAALYTQYRQLAETVAAVWGRAFVARREEEEAVFSNVKQMYKLMLLLASSTEKDSPSFNWIVEMLTFCMRTIQPLTAQLRPADYPRVAAPLLQCVQILAEERAKEVLGLLRPSDVAVLMQLVAQALVVDAGRVRQPAFEVMHSFCRFFLGLQLQQQAYTMALEPPPDAPPDPFISPTQRSLQAGGGGSSGADAAGRVPVEETGGPDTLLELYVQLAHLVPALLAHALSNPLSNTDVDFISDCLFDLLFMVGLRAYALKLLLQRFAELYCSGRGQTSTSTSGGSGLLLNATPNSAVTGAAAGLRIADGEAKNGGVSLQLLEIRLAGLLEAILQAVNELVVQQQRRQQSPPSDTTDSQTGIPILSTLLGGPAGLVRYQRQQQAFRDLIKAFVAECSSPTAAAAVRADSNARGTAAALRSAHIHK